MPDLGSVSIFAVGDLMLGDSPKMFGAGARKASESHGGMFFFEKVRNDIRADFIFGNLESVLSDIGFDRNCFNRGHLRGTPQMATVLKNVGFNVINVANNHMMQFGPEPFIETCQELACLGIAVVGSKGNCGWNCQPVILEKGNIKVGFLGYADPDQYGFEPLYALNIEANILEDIVRIKPMVDKIIVSLHWGCEFIRSPSPSQKKIARKIIDSGVDLILGHHAHVVQNVEFYQNGIICYGLGNFISDMIWNPRTKEGLAMKFHFISDEVQTEIHKVTIGSRFMPKLTSMSFDDLSEYVKDDNFYGTSVELYEDKVKKLLRDDRNRSHVFLILNFFRYSPLHYIAIWKNSFRSLFKK